MRLEQFNFQLDPEQIAKYPAPYRDEARMMVVHRDTGAVEHKVIRDLPQYMEEGDQVVVNDTKVFPARLYGENQGQSSKHKPSNVELFLLRELNADQHIWDVLVSHTRSVRRDHVISFGDGELKAVVLDAHAASGKVVRFMHDEHNNFYELLDALAEMPVPGHLGRATEKEDRVRMQSIFARHSGSVSPAASSLHFTEFLVKSLDLKGMGVSPCTLHISLSPCCYIDVDTVEKFSVDVDNFNMPASTAQAINAAYSAKKRVIAVGIDVLKCMYFAWTVYGRFSARSGYDKVFFVPGMHDKYPASGLLTNFYQPVSQGYINTCGFGGYDLISLAYQEAINEGYRFGTFGDGLLIL